MAQNACILKQKPPISGPHHAATPIKHRNTLSRNTKPALVETASQQWAANPMCSLRLQLAKLGEMARGAYVCRCFDSPTRLRAKRPPRLLLRWHSTVSCFYFHPLPARIRYNLDAVLDASRKSTLLVACLVLRQARPLELDPSVHPSTKASSVSHVASTRNTTDVRLSRVAILLISMLQ